MSSPAAVGPLSASDLEAWFTQSYRGIELEVFQELPEELWSEAYFRSNELAKLYIDAWIAALLVRLGLAAGEPVNALPATCAALGVAYERTAVFAWLVDELCASAWVRGPRPARRPAPTGDSFPLPALPGDLVARLRRLILDDLPAIAPVLDLADRAAAGYPEFLRGERAGSSILFAPATLGMWERFFDNQNPFYEPANRFAALAASAVLDDDRARAPGGIRILEVGGGCGSGSELLLEHLRAPIGRYLLTDISPNFLRKARERLAERAAERLPGGLEVRFLDLNQEPERWGLEAGSFDLVHGVNVLHSVRDLDATLAGLRQLLAPAGALVLGECVRPAAQRPFHAEFIFQLIDAFRDVKLHPERRPRWGFLDAGGWRRVLEHAGFAEPRFLPDFERAVAAYPEHAMAGIAARRDRNR